MKFPLAQKIGLGFGTALAILIVLSALSYWSTLRLLKSNKRVEHTHQVIETVEELLSLMKDIQSSQRGYILTGEDRYLDPYRAAEKALGKNQALLRQLTADNPSQQVSLDRLEGLIALRLEISQKRIELHRVQGFEAARQDIIKGEGKQVMDQIRELVAQIKAEEEGLLQRRLEEEETSAQHTLTLILLGNLLAISAVVLASWRIHRDLRTRQRAEAEVDRFFNLSLSLMRIGDFAGNAKRLNPAWEKTLGYTQEELLAKPLMELVHPEDLQASLEARARAKESGLTSFENRYRCKDGSYKWFLWSAASFAEERLFYAVGSDITERKQAEEEQAHRLVVTQVHRAVLEMEDVEDFERIVKVMARELEGIGVHIAGIGVNLIDEITGTFTAYNIIGGQFMTVVRPLHLPINQQLLEYWRRREVWERRELHSEMSEWHPATYRPALIIDVPFEQGTVVVGLRAAIEDTAPLKRLLHLMGRALSLGYKRSTDIAQRRQAEEQLRQANRKLKESQTYLVQSEKMASLGQLVAGIAHEINNPIAFVASNLFTSQEGLELVAQQAELEGAPAERLAKVRKRLEEAGEGVKRVEVLVHKLRTFSRLDEGQFKTVDIHESLDSVLLFLHHRMKERIQVEKHYGPHSTLYCTGELNQVLMNLVANAVDAIEGEGKITLGTGQRDGFFFISVKDTGKGIPQAARERLFEPFFTTKPVGQGTGLGLAIAHSIVQAHQGYISVHSEESRGTEMVIEIPLDLETRTGEPAAQNGKDGL